MANKKIKGNYRMPFGHVKYKPPAFDPAWPSRKNVPPGWTVCQPPRKLIRMPYKEARFYAHPRGLSD